MRWDAMVSLGVLDEHAVRKIGLLDNPQALLYAIETGALSWKRRHLQKNTVTNYARQYVVSMLTGTTSYPLVTPSKMELGTGTGAPAQTDTDLWSPSVGTLKLCSTIQSYLTYFAQYITTWQSSDPIQGTWTEIGLKDANGNLWAHSALTSNVPVNTGEMLVGQWQVQILGD